MAEGEINIDNLIQRLLEGQFWFENQKLVKSYLLLVSSALVKKKSSNYARWPNYMPGG